MKRKRKVHLKLAWGSWDQGCHRGLILIWSQLADFRNTCILEHFLHAVLADVNMVSYMGSMQPYLPGSRETWKKMGSPTELGHADLNSKHLSTPQTCASTDCLTGAGPGGERRPVLPVAPTPNLALSFTPAFYHASSSAHQHIPSQ